MKYAGFGLFVAGLILASWYAAYVPEGVGAERIANWASEVGLLFGVGWIMMLAGVGLARASRRGAPEDEEAASGAPSNAKLALRQVEVIAESIDALASRDLDARGIAADEEAIAEQLEAILEEQVPVFLDARDDLVQRYGLEHFAELIGHFAVMERAVARAWSALTDEVCAEVPPSLAKAKAAIDRAREVAATAR